MRVDYITHSGDDLLVVNAARVSFDKHKEEFGDDDKKLLHYLAKHNHWTPFSHPQITLRPKAPVCIRTQCYKHKQGFTENEVSRRYVDDEPEFFFPDFRKRSPSAKQGSLEESVDKPFDTLMLYTNSANFAGATYKMLLEAGACPEQARMVLPQGMYTQWYWTGSLAAYARFYKQRTDPHAQKEIQDLAKIVGNIIQTLFPVSWEVLTSES